MQFENSEQARKMARYTREYGYGMDDFTGRINEELATAYDYIGMLLDQIESLKEEH